MAIFPLYCPLIIVIKLFCRHICMRCGNCNRYYNLFAKRMITRLNKHFDTDLFDLLAQFVSSMSRWLQIYSNRILIGVYKYCLHFLNSTSHFESCFVGVARKDIAVHVK